jgi:CRP-like cAMP-binding protein
MTIDLTVESSRKSGNRLFDALPDDVRSRLQSLGSRVPVKRRDALWEPNRPIEFVYFPIDSIISLLAVDRRGHAVEIGTVGAEGFAGLPVLLGGESFPGLALVQVSGEVDRIRARDFRRVVQDSSSLHDVLDRYAQSFMTQVAQGTACNRLHLAPQRLARWLLDLQDRLGREDFPLTHEFIAQMLGVRRATVTETAQALQRAGVIQYQRGWLTVTDRAGLATMSCECYRIVREEYDRLVGASSA